MRAERTVTTRKWKRTTTWSLLGLAGLLLAQSAGPAPALARRLDANVGAVLYEVAENAYFLDANGNPTSNPDLLFLRVATAHLTGWAALGTALCPSELLLVYPRAKRCAVNATGTDYVYVQGVPGQLAPGTGPVEGSFTVVVQGDNPTDGPEAVVLTGTFAGQVDLSPVLLGTPVGYLTGGVFAVDPGPFGPGGSFAFSGVFRLPFSLGDGVQRRPWPHMAAYYLDDRGRPRRVQAREHAIGWATVRLEIDFAGQ